MLMSSSKLFLFFERSSFKLRCETVLGIALCYNHLASSRRSVSQGAAQKTAREKIKKKARRAFLFFRALSSALHPGQREHTILLSKDRVNKGTKKMNSQLLLSHVVIS